MIKTAKDCDFKLSHTAKEPLPSCDLILFPARSFPTTNSLTMLRSATNLSELQGQDTMVLVLSRGGFLPKDRRQAELLVQFHRELEVGYCRLVTISTDNITLTNEYRTGVGAHWPFLSDAGRVIQKDLDIAEYTRFTENHPMIPHVIVLEPGLRSSTRSTTAIGFSAVRRLRISVRTCVLSPKNAGRILDITTPEMKAAWSDGRKELFYPYGKTYAQTLGEQD